MAMQEGNYIDKRGTIYEVSLVSTWNNGVRDITSGRVNCHNKESGHGASHGMTADEWRQHCEIWKIEKLAE
jgi:predicted heme/steroid binding protein